MTCYLFVSFNILQYFIRKPSKDHSAITLAHFADLCHSHGFSLQTKEVYCLLILGVTQGALLLPHTLLSPTSSLLQNCLAVLRCKRALSNSCSPQVIHLWDWFCSASRAWCQLCPAAALQQEGDWQCQPSLRAQQIALPSSQREESSDHLQKS